MAPIARSTNGEMRRDNIVRARKDHRCSLCHKTLLKDRLYVSRRMTPWDHSENDGFFQYRAHIICDTQWMSCGAEVDWILPEDPVDWQEIRDNYLREQERTA